LMIWRVDAISSDRFLLLDMVWIDGRRRKGRESSSTLQGDFSSGRNQPEERVLPPIRLFKITAIGRQTQLVFQRGNCICKSKTDASKAAGKEKERTRRAPSLLFPPTSHGSLIVDLREVREETESRRLF